jgi:hypothetical protein
MVQVLTFFAAGSVLQTPAEGDPQLSVTVPVGVAPVPVQVVTEVTVVVGVFGLTRVGFALEVMLVAVAPVTDIVPVPLVAA